MPCTATVIWLDYYASSYDSCLSHLVGCTYNTPKDFEAEYTSKCATKLLYRTALHFETLRDTGYLRPTPGMSLGAESYTWPPDWPSVGSSLTGVIGTPLERASHRDALRPHTCPDYVMIVTSPEVLLGQRVRKTQVHRHV